MGVDTMTKRDNKERYAVSSDIGCVMIRCGLYLCVACVCCGVLMRAHHTALPCV